MQAFIINRKENPLGIRPMSSGDIKDCYEQSWMIQLALSFMAKSPYRDMIDEAAKSGKRHYFYAPILDRGGQVSIGGGVGLYTDLHRFPDVSKDLLFHEYVKKYDTRDMIPIYVKVLGSSRFQASVVGIPWMTKQFLTEVLPRFGPDTCVLLTDSGNTDKLSIKTQLEARSAMVKKDESPKSIILDELD